MQGPPALSSTTEGLTPERLTGKPVVGQIKKLDGSKLSQHGWYFTCIARTASGWGEGTMYLP